jgi:hypothetical protein
MLAQRRLPLSGMALATDGGPEIMKNRRGKPVKPPWRRRNPMAKALRDALFRARREANRRRYSRKPKHPRTTGKDDD